MSGPQMIVILTGGSNCAKEFMAKVLTCVFGESRCYTINVLDSIQSIWSMENVENNPQMAEMNGDISLTATEKLRKAMVKWSNEIRAQDPGSFFRVACGRAPLRDCWFVCGVKRQSEIEWFKRVYGNIVKTVRVTTMEALTYDRNWEICKHDIDDDIPDYDLEEYWEWDFRFFQSNVDELCCSLQFLTEHMMKYLGF